jgi:hypothetical protein
MMLVQRRSGMSPIATALLSASLIAVTASVSRNSTAAPRPGSVASRANIAAAIIERRPLEQSSDTSPLSIDDIELRPAPDIDGAPSAFIAFNVTNEGWQRVTDIVIEVSIVEKQRRPDARRKVLVGPFTIRGKASLDPGNALSYEMRLRNLSSDCNCLGTAKIVSSHPTFEWFTRH